MTFQEVYQMLTSTGLEVVYYQFPANSNPQLPYIVYYYPQSNNFGADDSVFKKIQQLNIELYTKEKSFVHEQLLEDVLDANGFYYEKNETYIDSEMMYEVLYEMEVVING